MTLFDEQAVDNAIAHESPAFRQAIKAVVTADLATLDKLLTDDPSLAAAHSASAHGATLLHYVAANSIEDELQLYQQSIYQRLQAAQPSDRLAQADAAVQVVTRLVAAGALVDALPRDAKTSAQQTPLNWLVSSCHPAQAGVMGQLVRTFCDAGAKVDGVSDDSSPLVMAMAFGYPEAIRELVDCGARTNNLLLAAAAGNLSQVKAAFVDGAWRIDGVADCEFPWFKLPVTTDSHTVIDAQAVAELSLVFASMGGHVDVVKFMLNSGVDINAFPAGTHVTATPLHTAAYQGQLDVVQLLIQRHADPTIKEPRYHSTATGWAHHGGHPSVARRLREYTPVYRRQTEGETLAIKAFVEAVFKGNVAGVQSTLQAHPLTPEQLNGPWFHFDAPAVVQVKHNLPLVDVLVEAGADINKKSDWWAGGFGVLDGTDVELADALIERGAKLDVWSAAELGRLPELRSMIKADPQQVHAAGPDGKRPLHCAKDVDIAQYLVAQGADIDALDIDHTSTAAQYHVKDRPEVARFLVQQGCRADILLACALGEDQLVKTIVQRSPESLDTIVGRKWFPSDAADSIYSWVLGWYVTPHQVADRFGHDQLVQWLLEASTPSWAVVNACLLGMG